MTSIINSLGYGSGLDVKKLVSDLADASRVPKVQRLDERGVGIATSISAVAKIKSRLDGVVGALAEIGASTTAPTVETVKADLSRFVAAYNDLKDQFAGSATQLTGSGLRALDRELAGSIGPALARLGVQTQRNGALAIDQAALSRALAADPAAVRTALVGADGNGGLGQVIEDAHARALGEGGALNSLTARLDRQSLALSKDREALEQREARYREQLERRFAGIDGRMGALKATQSYLEQQVKLWTKS